MNEKTAAPDTTPSTSGPRARVSWRAALGVSLLVTASLGTALIIFEIFYRWQVLDTYRPELMAYNNPDDLREDSDRDTILIMGDSFTAGADAYPTMMRASQSRYRVINAGITASGILEALAVAPRRFRRFHPSVFIYQVYLGNDLFNIRYPVSWGQVSLLRNFYWVVAQRFRSIGYLNYRAGQIRYAWNAPDSAQRAAAAAAPEAPFSPERYVSNDRINLEADPWLLENHILVARDRVGDYELFLSKLDQLLSYCDPAGCRAFVLVIPHCCQVTLAYLENTRRLGAAFGDAAEILQEEYPFISGIRELLLRKGYGHVMVLNPLRILRESEEAGVPVYLQNDPHLRRNGEYMLADLLLDRISAQD